MDAETVSDGLEILSSGDAAKRKGRHIRTLRGVRGVPDGEVARVAAATWLDDPPDWPRDRDELGALFMAAHEDGLVAISLLAALVPDDADGVFDLAIDWLGKVDDVATADALGAAVLGPAALSCGGWHDLIARGRNTSRPEGRRAVVVAALAALPAPLTGPGFAALRARLAVKDVRVVDESLTEAVSAMLNGFVRDNTPPVQKGLRRVVRTWSKVDREAAKAWADAFPGGIPKTLRAELR